MRLNFIQRYYADVEVGAKLTLDKGDATKSLKEFKQEVRAAEADLLNMTRQFGATSDQARNAAKRVAELKDELGDAKQLVDAFNPDKKFNALTQSLNGVLGGFTALQGAMGLLGVESEDLQKQLLKVQSALALSQGFNQVGEAIQSFKTLGKTLVNTLGKGGLIGIAIAGVTALGLALMGVFNRNRELIQAQKEFEKAAMSARIEVRQLEEALKQARAGIISKEEALKKFNSTIGQTVGETNDLNKAEQLLRDNAQEYIRVQGLKAKSNFLLAESARLSGKAELLRIKLETEVFNPEIRRIMELEAADLDRRAKLIESKIGEINSQLSGSKLSGAAQFAGGAVGGAAKKGSAKTPGGQAKEAEIEEIKTLENMLAEWEANKARQQLEQHKINAENIKNVNTDIVVKAIDLSALQTIKEKNESLARIQIAEEEARAKIEAAKAIGGALGALSELVGKQTAAGKALAIAQATINMWVGVSEVLSAKSVLPEPFATISKIANIAAIVANGILAIKNIVKVQVPGAGGSAPGVSAPLQPQPQVSNTMLNQNQLNAIGNTAVRSFVVESDITNSQDRIRRLNRAARI